MKKSIVGAAILFSGWFLYMHMNSRFNGDAVNQNIHYRLETKSQSDNKIINKSNSLNGQRERFAPPGKMGEITQHQSNTGESLDPERDQFSSYYLEEEEHKRLKEDGFFKGKAKDKLFEIRRKLIDSNFDAKKMSENLAKKLNEAPNGKLTYEEFLNLMPKDTVADFEEMMHLVQKGTE